MDLGSADVQLLIDLIKDSFRVRKNVRPIYVEVGDHLDRIGAQQHQIIFGRRGSGKSCLLVEYFSSAPDHGVHPVYILADEFKRLAYPDILIRLLIEILDALSKTQPWYRRWLFRKHPATMAATDLRSLLDQAEEREVAEGKEKRRSGEASAGIGVESVGKTAIGGHTETANSRTATYREKKIDHIERHLREYKNAIQHTTMKWKRKRGCVLVDDFYLIPREWQPDVVDYLHRLLRDTDVYLKVATIRHRTSLLKNRPHTIGVELAQDVEEINLDRTLEDLEETQAFLFQMLNSMGERAGVARVGDLFNPDALQGLTLASGGVPRDFLTVFVHAAEKAVAEGRPRWITPTYVYKGAGRFSYQTKLRHLREDAAGDAGGLERVLVDLMNYCLKEKHKTGFLISQEEAQRNVREHEYIQQLMDFKLIHVVEPDTSAASGRPGRYEAYTLDFSLFMEPRRRGIEIVEFWKRGEDSHRVGVREMPVYPLERARRAFDDNSNTMAAVEFIEKEEKDATTEHEGAQSRKTGQAVQGSLFKGVNPIPS